MRLLSFFSLTLSRSGVPAVPQREAFDFLQLGCPRGWGLSKGVFLTKSPQNEKGSEPLYSFFGPFLPNRRVTLGFCKCQWLF